MIRRLLPIAPVLAALVLASSSTLAAQQAAAKPSPDPISFKVTVVISRWQGEKRISSLPFTIFVPNGDRSGVRMGGQVPVPQLVVTQREGNTTSPTASYQYNPVGTNIDVISGGNPPENGRYKLKVTVSDNQVAAGPTSPSADASPVVRAMPVFQNFSADSWLLIRDGETIMFTTATDKISGEVTKVEVTLNVQK